MAARHKRSKRNRQSARDRGAAVEAQSDASRRSRNARRATSRQPISLSKKIVFSLVACGIFFLGAELLLAVVGVRPVLYDEDPYVGFAAHIPLFVSETGDDGVAMMVTARNKLRFFNPQQFPRDKAAGTRRVFCLGGSTTYGRPYDDTTSFCGWLRAMLPVADPSQQWEVINAGGISYASYRVANVAEELLEYDPDLFIIYCGQNEFLEQRTYAKIRELPSAVVGLGGALSHTRVFSTVRRVVEAATRDDAPDATDRDLLPGEVKTLLDGAVGPEQYRRDDKTRDDVLEHYRYNLARMVQAIRSVGAEVVLVTPSSKLRQCAPFKSQHRDGLTDAELSEWNEAYARAEDAMATGDETAPGWDDALAALDETLAIDQRYAHAHYLRGRALWELNRHEEAKTAFVRARDEDVCPLRALTPMREIVAEVADTQHVPLVDFVAITERAAEHATPGDDLFLDHVHPTIEGNRLLALALLETLAEDGFVKLGADWNEAAAEQVKVEVEASLDREAHGIALRNLAKVLNWAGKFEEGAKAAKQAVELIPDDVAAHYEIGVSTARQGRDAEAMRHFVRVVQLDPKHTDARNSIGMTLMDQGHLDEAIRQFRLVIETDPNFTKSYINLGVALESRGDVDKAIAAFRQALKIDPNIADAHNNLANALQYKQQYSEAIEHYQNSLQLRPNAVEEHYNLARAYQATRRYDLAVDHYQQALRLQPDLAVAHHSLGDTLRALGRTDEAAAHLREAIRLRPDDDVARAKLKALEAAASQP